MAVKTLGLLVVLMLVLSACGGDAIDKAISCTDLVREFNKLAETTTGDDASELRERADDRLDELIDEALNDGRDSDARDCELGRGEMQVLQGRFVGIDVEIPVGSYWEVTFSPNGQWSGTDSATKVCEKYLSRTWGEFWETDTPNQFAGTINVECLEGPNEGMVFDLGESSQWLIYDPVEDTILQDTNALPEGRDVRFCRIPCDPYDYYAGPYG